MILGVCILSGVSVNAADTSQTDTTKDTPVITKAQMISDCDIELYWSEAVTEGAGNTPAKDIDNFSVTVDGQPAEIYQYTWEGYDIIPNTVSFTIVRKIVNIRTIQTHQRHRSVS